MTNRTNNSLDSFLRKNLSDTPLPPPDHMEAAERALEVKSKKHNIKWTLGIVAVAATICLTSWSVVTLNKQNEERELGVAISEVLIDYGDHIYSYQSSYVDWDDLDIQLDH